MIEYNVWGQPLGGKKRKKQITSVGGLTFGLAHPKRQKQLLNVGFGFDNKNTNITKREPVPMIWRDKILMKQKNKCAGNNCAKLHNGKKLMVNNRSDFDHITPLALDGKHTLSNLQALCPGCHRLKTREDKYKISQRKKKKNKADNEPFSSLFPPPPKHPKEYSLGV